MRAVALIALLLAGSAWAQAVETDARPAEPERTPGLSPKLPPDAPGLFHVREGVMYLERADMPGAFVPNEVGEGRFMTEFGFSKLEEEVKRLQTVEINLRSQNASLGESLATRPHGFGLRGAVVFVVGGIVLGVAATYAVTQLAHR